MNELFHVIQREYLTRAKSKAFIIITLLTPFILSSIILLPTYFAKQHDGNNHHKIGLIDKTFLLENAFDNSDITIERIDNIKAENIESLLLSRNWDGILYVVKPDSVNTNIQLYSTKQPSIFLQNQLKSSIQKVIIDGKLKSYGIDNVSMVIDSVKGSIIFENIKVGVNNQQKINIPYQRSLCLLLGIAIYLFIFLFSSQVMRGVLEEKSNRIVELIITSVSPVKFMAGKIIGIALLGLTQIFCWIIILCFLSSLISKESNVSFTNSFFNQHISSEDLYQILDNLNQIDFHIIIPLFIFFFIGGYFLYSSLFAAIAASANHNDDIQQTTLIVTIPLILSVFVLTNTVNSPDSTLSYWFSIIPFTSPIVMMGRVIYGAPSKDIILSMILLIATATVIVWLSGKVYRMTILNSGRRLSLNNFILWIKNINK